MNQRQIEQLIQEVPEQLQSVLGELTDATDPVPLLERKMRVKS